MVISKIKRIPPGPIALAVGLVNAALGLILGILSAVNLVMINKWLAEWAGIAGVTVPQLSVLNIGALLIIGYPIGGFIVGFLGTLIVAHVYNIVARRAPIHVELK